jgi:hypothetical protein
MHALLLASLAALSFSPPERPGPPSPAETAAAARRVGTPWKVTAQAVGGAGAGLVAGGTLFVMGAAQLFACDNGPCGGGEGVGTVLLLAAPAAFAVAEGATVYALGRKVDGDAHGSLGKTMTGAVVGTLAGAAITAAGRNGVSFAAGVGVATAAAVFAYDRSRPRTRESRGTTITIAPDFGPPARNHHRGVGLRVAVQF